MQTLSNLHRILQVIIGNTNLHARWLNTLSFLEYVGARKILKSQCAEEIDCEILAHVHEETRHALFLKKLSLRILPEVCLSYDFEHMTAGRAAKDYFQKLDRFCAECVSQVGSWDGHSSRLIYVYVSWMIEVRALQVYKPYQACLTSSITGISLKPLLLDEERHLRETEEYLNRVDKSFSIRRGIFLAQEDIFFREFLDRLCEVCLSSSSSKIRHVGSHIHGQR